ncbi:MAG: hypothetical protein CMC86_03870 [Flavobacteriaceae bacterium]|nr:hypothetical protein [Flavobacteriaceae bacterium]
MNEFTVGGINFDWDNQQYRLDVRPFLHGNSYFSNLDDFKKLIDCINQFHKIAFKFPNFAKIKSNQKQISEKQNQTRNKCLEALNKEKFNFFENHSGWAKNNQKWLTKILEEYNPYFEDMLGAQCLHGQIHPGNVLFVRGNPILFDTETSIHTFAPVEWDFSWVLQRFIINQELSNEDSLKFIKLLAKNKSEIAKLIYMAKLNTIYSVVAVFDYSINKSISVPQSELDKFYNNYMSLCDYELYLRDAYEI